VLGTGFAMVLNSLPPETIDTGEVFDCVVIGGG
jgi:hypothetical protein